MPPTTRARQYSETADTNLMPGSGRDENAHLGTIKSRYLRRKSTPSTQAMEGLPQQPQTPIRAEEDLVSPQAFTAEKHGREADEAERDGQTDTKKPKASSTRQNPNKVQYHLDSLKDVITEQHRELEKANKLVHKFSFDAESAEEAVCRQQGEIQELQERYEKLESKHKAVKANNRALIAKNKALEKTSESWHKKLIEELDGKRPDYGDPDKVCDGELYQRWSIIDFIVTGMVNACMTTPAGELDTTSSSAAIAKLVDECAGAFPYLQTFLIQRYIWKRLCRDLFRAKNGIWAGELGENFVKMAHDLRAANLKDPKKLSIISRMKFRTGADIDKEIGPNPEAVGNVAEKLYTDLLVFAKPEHHERLRGSVSDVVKRAAHLMVIMTRSRAFFSIGAHLWDDEGDGPCDFLPDSMELKHAVHHKFALPDETWKVIMVVTPAVEKTGTADGFMFEHSYFVCKARVVTRPGVEVELVEEDEFEVVKKEYEDWNGC